MSRPLDTRLAALAEAVDLAAGRLDGEAVERAREVVRRAGIRLGLGVDTTVVALAGPTGAGKSTLFNALAGEELVAAGVRRPTTATVTAATRGPVDPALLDWLGAARRHALPGDARAGFVLLDLPDYDSVETSHRVEVERIIELVDLLVWVADPQKYADAALHDRYLKPLSGYGEAMVVVLNQADRLDDASLRACRGDLARLLAEDGLPELPVLALSARDGSGLEALEELLRRRTEARAAAHARLGADVTAATAGLDAGCDAPRGAGRISGGDRRALTDALAEAAGVPFITRAVAGAHRRNGRLAAGWPYGRWLAHVRPDPLKRLRLGDRPDPGAHSSIPRATAAQRAQVFIRGECSPGPPAPPEASPTRCWRWCARQRCGRRTSCPSGWTAWSPASTCVSAARAGGWRPASPSAPSRSWPPPMPWLLALALGPSSLGDALGLPDWHGIPWLMLLLAAACCSAFCWPRSRAGPTASAPAAAPAPPIAGCGRAWRRSPRRTSWPRCRPSWRRGTRSARRSLARLGDDPRAVRGENVTLRRVTRSAPGGRGAALAGAGSP